MLIYSQRIITKESAFNIIWGVLWSENQAQPINISSFGQKKIHSRLVYCRGKGNPRVSHGFFHGYGYGYENPDPRKTRTRGCGYGFSNSEPARRHFFSQTAPAPLPPAPLPPSPNLQRDNNYHHHHHQYHQEHARDDEDKGDDGYHALNARLGAGAER